MISFSRAITRHKKLHPIRDDSMDDSKGLTVSTMTIGLMIAALSFEAASTEIFDNLEESLACLEDRECSERHEAMRAPDCIGGYKEADVEQ